MAEHRIVAEINYEFELPEHIIQHIQSFLTGKAAAQTALLSKSWRKAWLTRPSIDFDCEEYCPNYDGLLELANNTIQRYEESNLKIDFFKLRLRWLKYDDNDLADTLILKALKLCAHHLSFEIELGRGDFVIAREVFESENLLGLSLEGCGIDIGMDHNVRCSKLQSLSLNYVEIHNPGVIFQIISSCPLIENLSLAQIRYYEEPVISGPISLPKLHNIKCLVLSSVHFDTLFLCDLSSTFPFLKDLTLNGFWHGNEEEDEIPISSHSLEHLNLAKNYRTSNVMFELDVPSIRKFTFEGSFIPSVSFKPTSREWESHVSIKYTDTDPLDTSWFLGLNELLTALIPSKIYLSINGESKTCFSYKVLDIQGLPQAEVENLLVDIRYLPIYHCYVLFDGIFRACRPKFITQYLLPDSYLVGKTNSDFLCKTLARGVNGEFSHPWDFMYGLNGLMEVNVQVFDEFVAVWKDLPCKSLLEASESPQEKKTIRFQLLWRP